MFRRACLDRTNADWRRVNNLIWAAPLLGVFISLSMSWVWLQALEQPDDAGYSSGVAIHAASAVVELLSEPLWVWSQAHFHLRVKIFVEGVAVVSRSAVTLALLQYASPDMHLLLLSATQLLQCSVVTAMYYGYFWWGVRNSSLPIVSIRELFPLHIQGQPFSDPALISLCFTFFRQGLLKQVLTEGERIMMTVFNLINFEHQGVFDVVNNLGSLVARFLFQPLEENSYLYFSNQLSRSNGSSAADLPLVSKTLQALIKLLVLVGLVVFIFGQSYSFLLLRLYGGENLSSGPGPSLLRVYCMYVLLMGINGVTEAFMTAAASKEYLDQYSWVMCVFTAVFLMSTWVLGPSQGAAGFILANCVNMGMRIMHHLVFIHRCSIFKQSRCHPMSKPFQIVPAPYVLCAFLLAWLVTRQSEAQLCSTFKLLPCLGHVAIGVFMLMLIVVVIVLFEKDFMAHLRRTWKGKSNSGKSE